MRLQDLKLGKSIEIILVRNQYRLRLVSKIEYVKLDAVYISLIVGKGKPFKFEDTDIIEFIYKDDNKLWKWEGVQGEFAKLDDELVHCLRAPIHGINYNRRDSFRVFVGEESFFHYVPMEHKDILFDNRDNIMECESPYLKKSKPCLIKDISETGIGIYTNEDLSISDIAFIRMQTNYGMIEAIAEVVRKQSEFEKTYHYFYGLQYKQVSKNIGKYVFALQRAQLANKK